MSDKPVTTSPAGAGRSHGDDIAVNSDLLTGVLDAHRRLQADDALAELMLFLLSQLPASLGAAAAELHLLDADGDIGRALPASLAENRGLTLSNDSLALQALYASTPQIEIIGFADERMFRVLPWAPSANGAVLIPLLDEGRLAGSYHLGLAQEAPGGGRAELKLLQSLMHGVSLSLQRALRRDKADGLMLLDAETGVGNQRAFQRVLEREIARARRTAQPLSVLRMKVDNLDDLCGHYGEAACRFLMRRLAQRVASCLRETDHLSRVEDDQFGVLLPACSEPHGHDIGERLCSDIRDFAIDDGRGGVLYSTFSIGVVSWDPATLPSDSRERLVAMLESEASSALAKTVRRGGNGVSISRLGALMI